MTKSAPSTPTRTQSKDDTTLQHSLSLQTQNTSDIAQATSSPPNVTFTPTESPRHSLPLPPPSPAK